MPDEIRLLLVDDHEIVRTGISMLLESEADMSIIGQASTGAQALEMASQLQPDVVIMDITLPDITGIEVTRQLKAQHPGIAVVALTIHEDHQYFFEMLQAGADGYVPKRAASEDLIKAIHAASKGEVFIYPSLAKVLVADFLTQAADEKAKETVHGITTREQEVLEMLAAGKSNEEIAGALSISKHTVARHRENVMRKLGLHSRSELVKYAIRKGLIEP
jgi:two-component system, NarL family, response regulator NreC